ncbi:MAG TPA: protein kinase, partial [Allocoleopsis sp.]
MSQCFNPDCLNLFPNLSSNQLCIHCHKSLLLKERFRAMSYLGEGGFGRTFVGIDIHRDDTPCVIKQLLPLQQSNSVLQKCAELFKQEAQLLKILGKHPQIPDLLAAFAQDNKLYLVQEFIEGQDLLKELKQKGQFSESEVKTFLLEMLPVLHFIHQKNVIHRDIKPENIIRRNTPLDPLIYGKISNLVLIDFGVSKQVSATMTQVGTTVGTPGYAPNEQLQGFPHPTSDLYSLAVTAIRLLTGCLRSHRSGNPQDELFNFRNFKWVWKEWLINNGLSIEPNLADVLDKMLAAEIDNRFQSAKDVLSALNQSQKVVISVQQTPVLNNQNTSGKIPFKTPSADYTKLEQFLVVKKWKEADQETANIMLKIMGRESRGYLDSDDCI